jgi:nucleoside-diphosphate-sugar epimerase
MQVGLRRLDGFDRTRRSDFPATLIHPGHIVGPGWKPLNPAGRFDPQVFSVLAQGKELALPNLGMETVHHVHADDAAQAFMAAISHRSVALGEAFHAVSPAGSHLARLCRNDGAVVWPGS